MGTEVGELDARLFRRLRLGLDYLRWHPHFLVLPGLVAWFLINTDSALIGLNLVKDLLASALLRPGHSNAITVLTYPLALVSVVLAGWWLRRFGWWRAALVALTVPFGWLMLFEVPWHLVGSLSPGYPFPVNEAGWIILASWSAVGALSFPYWRVTRWFVGTALVFVLLWAGWLAAGYPQIASGSAVALSFNYTLKGWAFVTFMVLLWPRLSSSAFAPTPPGSTDGRVDRTSDGGHVARPVVDAPARSTSPEVPGPRHCVGAPQCA